MNKDKIKWKGDSFESLGRWIKTQPGEITVPVHEPKGIITVKKSNKNLTCVDKFQEGTEV